MIFQKIKSTILKTILGFDISTYFFSQSGEDAILQAIFRKKFERKEKGFFVDVGAYHPYKASNTYLFYINGWSGINIDACPGSMKAFNKIRPKDINLEIGIGGKEEVMTYYFLDEHSTMNSFSKENLVKLGMYKQVKKEIPVRLVPLRNVLENYSNSFGKIDLLSIDAEGLDLEILKSNSWEKYRPSVIVAELDCKNLQETIENTTSKYLLEIGYDIVAKTVILSDIASVIFVDKTFEY